MCSYLVNRLRDYVLYLVEKFEVLAIYLYLFLCYPQRLLTLEMLTLLFELSGGLLVLVHLIGEFDFSAHLLSQRVDIARLQVVHRLEVAFVSSCARL